MSMTSTMSQFQRPDPNVDPELPVYSWSDPIEVEHTFSLMKSGQRFLTLATISGSVKLELQREAFVRSVTVTVFGEIISPSGTSRFLNIRRKLYSVESNESPRSSPGDQTSRNFKLKGSNEWPFSIKLPKGVGIPFGGPDGLVSKYVLPASLNDAASKTSVVYQLLIRVKKGTLSSGYKLSTPFEYLPLVQPEAPSILRQVAYAEYTPLFGPTEDPDGWKVLDVLRMAGTLFNTRPVEIEYAISLASPTSYTRGTPIHVWVEISSSDDQALDLLSTPSTLDLRLVRATSYYQTTYTMGLVGGNPGPRITETTDIASANFWSVSTIARERPDTKALQGEIVIPPDLLPGCHILNFLVEYEVQFYPLKAPGFTPANQSKKPLLTENITVATVPALGPQPLPHSPPQYT